MMPANHPHDPRPRRIRPSLVPLLIGAAVAGLAAGVVLTASLDMIARVRADSALRDRHEDLRTALEDRDTAGQLADAAEFVSPSVVAIQVTGRRESVFPRALREQSQAGSGVVLDDEGHILTNSHVIYGADGRLRDVQVWVVTHGEQMVPAEVVGADVHSDLAVLRVEDMADMLPCTTGDSDAVRVGMPVLAVGTNLGLRHTVTHGIISAVGRPISDKTIDRWLQTDAAINSGNSGGPLTDVRGRVIGINSLIRTRTGGSDGIGFAIPINEAMEVALDLMDDGKVSGGYLGVLAYPVGDGDGLFVQLVDPDEAAWAAGVRAGDRLMALDGDGVASTTDLVRWLRARQPGDRVTLTVERAGETLSLPCTLGAR